MNSIQTILLISTIATLTSADNCGTGDDIACANKGVCKNGPKFYSELGFPSRFTNYLIEEKRDMHCSCPNEPAYAGKIGWTGVHCDVAYEMCPNSELFCFNGGTCEQEQFRSDVYHCKCPQDPIYDVWAGTNCEVKAEDFCEEDEEFFDLTGGKWFCTHGGKCQNGEKNLAKKCICPEGTFGLHCEFEEEQQCNMECMNGGTCKFGLKDYSEMSQYGLDIETYLGGQDHYGEHCVCPPGFSGVKCELEETVQCGQGVCFNGAECVQTVSLDGKSVFNEYCRCNAFKDDENDKERKNYAGKYCEHEATIFCPAPYGHNPDEYFCTNDGECPDEPHQQCKCKNGFKGPRCEIASSAYLEDECDMDCQNGGQCFFGGSPIEDEKLQNLHNLGLDFLLENKHCRCPEGRVGVYCEIQYEKCGDDEHYCLNGSGCIPDGDEYTCDCRQAATLLDSYAGDYCEHAATEFCQGPGANPHSFCTNHGKCRGEIGVDEDHVGCKCEAGWTGMYCEYEKASFKVASKAVVGFAMILLVIVAIFGGILFFTRIRTGRDHDYEVANQGPPKHNPYELDSDLSDGSEDEEEEYEFTDVAII